MKLADLINALADEVESVRPVLESKLTQLSTLDVDDPSFMDALDQYSGQAQRMGEAAEMVGFEALQQVCSHVVDNTLLLAVYPPEERAPVISFLESWPGLIVNYLRHLDDPSCAAGLVDCLTQSPNPISEEEALKLMHRLGVIPQQVAAGVSQGEEQPSRPVLAAPEDVLLQVPADADTNLMEGFFHEAPEHVRLLVGLVRGMSAGTASVDDLTTAKRYVHTLKGSGATIGLRGITALSHHFEDILEHFETQAGQVAKPVADVLLDAAYCLEQMVGFVMGTEAYPSQAQYVLQQVLDTANRIDRGEAMDRVIVRAMAPGGAAAPTVEAADAAPATPRAVATAGGAALRVSLQKIEELFRVSGEVSVHAAAMETRIKRLSERSKELLQQNLRLQKRTFELETLVDVRAISMMHGRGGRVAGGSSFDPLEMDQYSELHSTTHALLEEAADVRSLSQRFENDIADLSGMQTRQQLLSRDLQHLVIGTRMTEVGVLESRLQRNVRTTAQTTGKRALLLIEGGETLIDSDVLNKLAEPLLHLLRNAVDHGLETPYERVAAGKTETGTIRMEFIRQGQQVVLRVRDDGRGIDHERVRLRAVERGLVGIEQKLSEDDISRLILMPGFSTRDAVSEVSGRGVGLDVVRDWIGAMNGSIRISSALGQGTQFELQFPASLSTLHSLIVRVSDQLFALPSVQVRQALAKGIGSFERLDGQMVFKHADRIRVAMRLSQLVNLPEEDAVPLEGCDAVIVSVNDKDYVLAVDHLMDSRELLIKNPGRYARHIRGVSGLSILGDGSIAVNLDLQQLLSVGQTETRGAVSGSVNRVKTESKLPSVLIVDDSLSVRNTLEQLVGDAGYRTETARDGVEAVSALNTFKPDVLLTDLEMPNMNGIELTQHVRGRPDLQSLPIIMITSRSQEKHRALARQAGVNTYITKPYTDADVVNSIRGALA